MSDFRKLIVWEKAHSLAVSVHRLASAIRHSQHASLRNQMIRASASIPTNIVEGSRQASRREFARFLRYALNSASELEYHLILARDVGATPEAETSALIEDVTEVRKMLHGLLRRITTANHTDASDAPSSTPV
ncbi:MAG TPA: four helix bundle protein [Gemmatimonadaceae bacterium]